MHHMKVKVENSLGVQSWMCGTVEVRMESVSHLTKIFEQGFHMT